MGLGVRTLNNTRKDILSSESVKHTLFLAVHMRQASPSTLPPPLPPPPIEDVLDRSGTVVLIVAVIIFSGSFILMILDHPASITLSQGYATAQSFIIIFGLFLTVSTTTAALSARLARMVFRELREMQPTEAGDIDELGVAITTAKGLGQKVFWHVLLILAVSFFGILLSLVLILTAEPGPVRISMVLLLLAILSVDLALMLWFLSHTAQLSMLITIPPRVPVKPCPQCNNPLIFVKEYQSTYCSNCGTYR